MNHWKEFISYCQYCTGPLNYYLILTALAKQAVSYQLLCSHSSKEGILPTELKEFENKILDIGGEKLVHGSDGRELVYVWRDGALGISLLQGDVKRHVSFAWASNNVALTEQLTELCSQLLPLEPRGSVYVLIPAANKLTTKIIGVGSSPIERNNYRPDAIRGFDKVVKDLQEPNPLGRISIFDGPPGTGKTYMVRALLEALPKLKFLILPSNMVDSLSGPQLLSALIEETKPTTPPSLDSENTKRQTLVLVIEDADRCLSKRGADNLSALSNLLNMSDGIVGSLLDLRIVCTTNAEITDIDNAILRTGRLSARVEVGLLEPAQAKTIYARIGGIEPQTWDKKFYALSDVYAMAKGLDSKETESSTKKRKIGF